ncbi:CHD1 helical C-terminal domain containing protein 1 [Emydura macquarii macquarii]|uniref:CHD1 helical C-terminal domain containing protein 1 n=1 Tax=Emydura macquarii macquarii TaxID=1129001 RepID=UPI00352A280D
MEVSESGGNGLCEVEKLGPEGRQTRENIDMGEWKCQARYGTASQTEKEYLLSKGNEATPLKKSSSTTPSRHLLICYTDGLDQDTFKICKEFLRPFKKSLRKLDLPKEFPEDKKLKYTKKNLTILGDHINMFLQHYCKSWELKHWKKMLWRFVSLFSELDEKYLRKLYKYSKSNQMAKFLKLYCSSENPNSVPVPENTKLIKLYDAWGLHGDINNMQEKLSQIQSQPSQTSLQGNSEAASKTKKRLCKTTSNTNKKGAADKHSTIKPHGQKAQNEKHSASRVKEFFPHPDPLKNLKIL